MGEIESDVTHSNRFERERKIGLIWRLCFQIEDVVQTSLD